MVRYKQEHTDEAINKVDLSVLLMDELGGTPGPRRGRAARVLAQLGRNHIGVAVSLLGGRLGREADLVGADGVAGR